MAQTINVDVTPSLFQPTLYYHQGDIGREFAINISTKDGYEIPSGATVKIEATKPSGFGFSVEGTLSDNTVTFVSTEGMTDEWGRFPAQLKISSGNTVIYTANFLMVGEKDTHPASTVDGSQEDVIPQLTLLVERVENAAAAVLDTTTEVTTLPAGSQATYSFDEETNTATFGIPEGEAGAGSAGVVASAYSASKTYAVGDYAIHNSNLYRCTTAITTAESFNASHWTQVVLADDVTDLKSDLKSYIENDITVLGIVQNEYVNLADGAFVAYNGWDRTDYIKIDSYTSITAKESGIVTYNAFYDANKNFVSLFTVNDTDTVIIPPSNAVYMVLSNSREGLASLKIKGQLKITTQVNQLVSHANTQGKFDASLLNENSNIAHHPTMFEDGYLIRSNGTTWILSGYGTSEYLSVEPNTKYYLSTSDAPVWVSFYDSSKTWIEGTDGQATSRIITTPNNSAYVRLGMETSRYGDAYILDTGANDYGVIPIKRGIVYDDFYRDKAIDFLEKNGNAVNLALGSLFEEGTYRTSQGWDSSATGWCRSDFIPVTPNTTYYTSSNTFVCFYDSNLEYLSGLATPSTMFTAPSDCAYIVASYEFTADDTYYISTNKLEQTETTIYVGANEEFTTIRSAIDYANAHKGTTIIVKKGTYDIVSEFGGQSQMPGGGSGQGMTIGNNTTLIFEPNAEVECIYTGGNADVESAFSIFNASHSNGTTGDDDYTIIGLKCRCKNIRYCIHDEMSSQSNPYVHKYINCDMYLDNTESSWDSPYCIGGGLGDSGDILVENCIFETGANNVAGVSWHNHWREGSKSVITVKDNYFRNCTVRFGNFGNQTENTICKVSNNALSSAPRVEQETDTVFPEKMELLAWNNAIHN